MIVGHYATALVAKRHDRQTPLWIFLLAAISLDILLLIFMFAGVESMMPREGGGLSSMEIYMPYSHDIVPVLFWTVLIALGGYVLTRRRSVAMWAGALVIVHELADLVAGFSHNVMGPDSMQVGIGLYSSSPLTALAIEAVFAAVCVYWYTAGVSLPRWRVIGLYATVALGILMILPAALPA